MKDCFAYYQGRCTALKKKSCDNCNFYKSREQRKKDLEKAYERLDSLPISTMNNITNKYNLEVIYHE